MGHGHGGEEGGEGGERWLVSYADFITLLMVLFVVLYSMGKVDTEKYKRLADSMRTAFTLGGAAKVVDVQINQSGGTMEDGTSKPIVVPGIPEGPPQSSEVAGQLTQMLMDMNLGSEVSVQTNIEGVLISLSEKLVFEQGQAEPSPAVLPVLDTIVEMVSTIKNKIRLIGHTDNQPPYGSIYASNWELSLARGMYVGNYLMDHGIDPDRITVSGRGPYDPVMPNDTNEHRSMNGRVDIVIVYEVESSLLNDTNLDITK
jgi:chemotaxis protein MotB